VGNYDDPLEFYDEVLIRELAGRVLRCATRLSHYGPQMLLRASQFNAGLTFPLVYLFLAMRWVRHHVIGSAKVRCRWRRWTSPRNSLVA